MGYSVDGRDQGGVECLVGSKTASRPSSTQQPYGCGDNRAPELGWSRAQGVESEAAGLEVRAGRGRGGKISQLVVRKPNRTSKQPNGTIVGHFTPGRDLPVSETGRQGYRLKAKAHVGTLPRGTFLGRYRSLPSVATMYRPIPSGYL